MPENILLTDVLHGGTNSLRTEITNTPVVTNANLDIALSALRDAITKTGETVKTLADIVDKLSDVGVTSLPSLIAGSNIVGKVGIDQTTPGITNAVVNKNASGNEIFTDASPGSMKLTGSNVTDATFHDEAVAAADGTVFTVGGNKTLTVEIYGTSTSRTVAFIGRGASSTDRALMGVKLSDLSTAISTTGTGELWQFDITGLTSVLMDLQAIAGGNVSIKGKAVA